MMVLIWMLCGGRFFVWLGLVGLGRLLLLVCWLPFWLLMGGRLLLLGLMFLSRGRRFGGLLGLLGRLLLLICFCLGGRIFGWWRVCIVWGVRVRLRLLFLGCWGGLGLRGLLIGWCLLILVLCGLSWIWLWCWFGGLGLFFWMSRLLGLIRLVVGVCGVLFVSWRLRGLPSFLLRGIFWRLSRSLIGSRCLIRGRWLLRGLLGSSGGWFLVGMFGFGLPMSRGCGRRRGFWLGALLIWRGWFFGCPVMVG